MSELLKLSVSKSATFESCRRKFQFSYILRLPKKEYSYHIFGRFAHRVLELFHQAYIEGSNEPFGKVMTISFNSALEEFKGKISDDTKKEVTDIARSYLALLKEEPESVQRVLAVEKVFNLEMGNDLLLTGMIDRVQCDSDGVLHVADYKTSRSDKYLKNDTLQLQTYAYVLWRENPEIQKVRVSYIMLRNDCKFLTKEFGLDDIKRVEQIYLGYAQDIRSETQFKPSPSRLCEYCDFLDSCDAGKETIKGKFAFGKSAW